MKIRSITFGVELKPTLDPRVVAHVGRFAAQLRNAYQDEGIMVQTLRLATQPFPQYLGTCTEDATVRFAQELQSCCGEHGIDFVSLGPVNPYVEAEQLLITILPRLIAETEVIFTSAVLVPTGHSVSRALVQTIARVVQKIAQTTEEGFGNLRFAGVVNCPPFIPFFPAAFHLGTPAFTLALEAADVIAEACGPDLDLDVVRTRIGAELERQVRPVQNLAQRFSTGEWRFLGIDLSPAPGPEPHASIAYALERCGLGRFGEPGTLALAALVTAAVRETQLLTCGYCGLMLPVLEDAGLAERNNQGLLRLSNLLSYSAVCGTGLDTIPLPGDASEDQLCALLLDVATLGRRLNKPLSARLLPIPGKQAGDLTEFTFSYFVNTQVMPVA
ncbi:MAG: DUF711 family protein [Candidatus Binatia bacterium]